MVYEEEEEGGREGWWCEEDGGARWRYEEGARRYGGTRKNHMKRMEMVYEEEDGWRCRWARRMEV